MRFIKAKHLKVGDVVLLKGDVIEQLWARIFEVKMLGYGVLVKYERGYEGLHPSKEEKTLGIWDKCIIICRVKKSTKHQEISKKDLSTLSKLAHAYLGPKPK